MRSILPPQAREEDCSVLYRRPPGYEVPRGASLSRSQARFESLRSPEISSDLISLVPALVPPPPPPPTSDLGTSGHLSLLVRDHPPFENRPPMILALLKPSSSQTFSIVSPWVSPM